MDCLQKDWYCIQCSLQFDSKILYDLHIKLVHVIQILTKSIENEPKKNESLQGEDKSLLDMFLLFMTKRNLSIAENVITLVLKRIT